MSTGNGGSPNLPWMNSGGTNIFDNLKQQSAGLSTAATSTNIFDLIKQSYSTTPSMTSVLPAVQDQYKNTSQNVAPFMAAIQKTGETNAAAATSDAGSRGMRGSDIEAAGRTDARNTASQQQSEMLSKLSMQQAETMAQYIMQAYGYDVQANTQLYQTLAQALGQELSQQREISMFEEQIKLAKKQLKEQSKLNKFNMYLSAGNALQITPAAANSQATSFLSAIGGSAGKMAAM
jgi:hypothetical protein